MKLALVDPKHLEYRDLQKSTEGQAKAGLSMEMRRILEDVTMPDDVKIKMYRKTLGRFRNVKDKLEDDTLPPVNYQPINYETPAKKPRRKSRRRHNWVEY